jgi:hypothetical protein
MRDTGAGGRRPWESVKGSRSVAESGGGVLLFSSREISYRERGGEKEETHFLEVMQRR